MESRPKTMQLQPRISDGKNGQAPAGIMTYDDNEGMLVPDGRALKPEDYPELFAAIGNMYTPPEFIELPLTRCQKVLRFVGIKVQPRKERNPAYRHGYFNLPDLHGCFVADPDEKEKP